MLGVCDGVDESVGGDGGVEFDDSVIVGGGVGGAGEVGEFCLLDRGVGGGGVVCFCG